MSICRQPSRHSHLRKLPLPDLPDVVWAFAAAGVELGPPALQNETLFGDRVFTEVCK